jgi:hypothetical protein
LGMSHSKRVTLTGIKFSAVTNENSVKCSWKHTQKKKKTMTRKQKVP